MTKDPLYPRHANSPDPLEPYDEPFRSDWSQPGPKPQTAEELRQTVDQLGVQLAAELRDKAELMATLVARDARIGELEALLRERELRIQTLEGVIQKRATF